MIEIAGRGLAAEVGADVSQFEAPASQPRDRLIDGQQPPLTTPALDIHPIVPDVPFLRLLLHRSPAPRTRAAVITSDQQ